tara:strand:+ start:2546 stop:2773 length:228 start_codon:yes stop_codon:yes gene_type:complete
MKIYRNLEGGYHVHYANKQDAIKGLKKAKDQSEVDPNYCFTDPDAKPELLEVPTDKKGLIKFLNEEANYTGFSPE